MSRRSLADLREEMRAVARGEMVRGLPQLLSAATLTLRHVDGHEVSILVESREEAEAIFNALERFCG